MMSRIASTSARLLYMSRVESDETGHVPGSISGPGPCMSRPFDGIMIKSKVENMT